MQPASPKTARSLRRWATPLAGYLALAAVAGASGCNDRVATVTGVETPDGDFVFEGVHLEDRQEGRLVWRAVARAADGAIGATRAQEIRLTHYMPGTEQTDYTIASPVAHLELEARKATFSDVQIFDQQGGTLFAGVAVYDGNAERIDVSGPLDFRAPGLTAHAERGQLMLRERTISIEGPVQGVMDPATTPRAPRSPLP